MAPNLFSTKHNTRYIVIATLTDTLPQNAGRRRAIGLTTVAVAIAVAIARADVELGSLIVVLVGAAALAADGLLAKQFKALPVGLAILPAAIVVAEVTPLV